MDSLMLLEESDLVHLGLTMGQLKLLSAAVSKMKQGKSELHRPCSSQIIILLLLLYLKVFQTLEIRMGPLVGHKQGQKLLLSMISGARQVIWEATAKALDVLLNQTASD